MRSEAAPPSALANLQLARFRLRLRPRETLLLPAYKGSALRGGFGQVFRRIACLGAELGFGECLLGARCPYHYIFETPPPAGSVVLDKVPTAPQPFVLEPPRETKRVYEPGEEFVFHLVLIGKALDYLPYFIYAFDELGRVGLGRGKGKYALDAVAWLDAVGTAVPVYDGSRKVLTDSFHALSLSLSQLSVSGSSLSQLSVPSPSLSLSEISVSFSISFLTPTRLKYENQLAADCEFHVFFRNLTRRIALLYYFHCGGEFPPERREFVESARAIEIVSSDLRWVDWERYSNRQQTRMRLGGFVGQVTYRGDFTEFFPYLLLGTYTHVGKGATFGLGAYRIERMDR
jgi:hypothetical protein